MVSGFAKFWALEPGLDFLNHGSFGACPRPVLEAQTEVRAALGAFVGADPDDLALVPNATTGVNTVLRSLELLPGDEIVTTDHVYNSCRNALRWQEERGVKVLYAHVPWPILGPWQVVEAVMSAVGERGIDTLASSSRRCAFLRPRPNSCSARWPRCRCPMRTSRSRATAPSGIRCRSNDCKSIESRCR